MRTSFGRIDVYASSQDPGQCSEDDWVVAPGAGFLRLAVVDGVTFTDQTPQSRPSDLRAAEAAGLVRNTLKTRHSPEVALESANEELFVVNKTREVPRDRAQATCAVADVSESFDAVLVQAGDCAAWWKRKGVWYAAFPGDVHTPGYRALEHALREPGHSHSQHLSVSRAIRDTPNDWNSTPIGRFAKMRIRRLVLQGVDELVLASDGALLTRQLVPDIAAAMQTVWARQSRAQLPKGRDDYVVLHWRSEALE